MNRTPSVIPPITTCQQDHQHWQQIIRQQEEEIRQLRALLLEVMECYNCRSLRHDAIDYYRDLNHLQTRLDRLNRDFVCEGVACQPDNENLPCTDTRFNLTATIERHAVSIMAEFSRVKAGCLQFLSGMMSLNML
jgi:hypothetical protein